jgi:hypothetical protein
MRLCILTLALLMPLGALAQDFQFNATAASLSTSVQTSAVADFGVRFTPSPDLPLAFRQENIVSPTGNAGESVNAFVAGFEYYGQPLQQLLAKLRLDTKKFQLYVTGAVGVDRVTDHTGAVTQHIAALSGGGLRYDPTGSGRFSVTLAEVRHAWLPGLFGTTNNAVIFSTGVSFRLGK